MSAFTDQIAADLGAFVNPTEFAGVRVIDGAQVTCVLDDSLLVPDPETGVYVSESLLHLKSDALTARPVINQRMVVDGKQGTVVNVNEAMGMLSVRLRWFES